MTDRIKKNFLSNNFVSLLSHPPYISFALSVFLSQIAYNMMSVVLIFLIFNLTNSNFSVSVMVLTFLIPQVFLSFLGGIVADMKNKKKILIIGNILRASALVLLFFNSSSVFFVYFISILVSVATQFYTPAEAPMIPYLVRKNHLITANSIFGIGFFSSVLIGYVLAGPLIDLVGRAPVFLVLAVFFGVAAFFAYLIPDTYRKEHFDRMNSESLDENRDVSIEQIRFRAARKVHGDLKDSYKLLKETGRAASAFFLLSASQIIILIIATIVPGYATAILKVKAESLSLLLFAPAAVGMIIAGLLLSGPFSRFDKNKLMTLGVFLSGISLCLFPLSKSIHTVPIISLLPLNTFRFAIITAFIAGFANALIFIPSQTIIQEVIPEHFRSKIYGLLFALIGLFSLIPIILTGTLADIIGVGSVLVGVGGFIIIIGLFRIRSVIIRSN